MWRPEENLSKYVLASCECHRLIVSDTIMRMDLLEEMCAGGRPLRFEKPKSGPVALSLPVVAGP